MRAQRHLTAAAAVLLALGTGAGSAVVGVVTAPPAYAAERSVPCRSVATVDDAGVKSVDLSYPDPYDEMRIADAQRAVGRTPGSGVTVAVLDSGIWPGVAAHVLRPSFKPSQTPGKYYHGTTVAGLIAGKATGGAPGGIAPGATLIDLPVSTAPQTGDEEPAVSRPSVEAALQYLNATRSKYSHLVVNLSLEFDTGSPVLQREIRRLVRSGAIVVAAAGNRTESDETTSPTPSAGPEDARDQVFPAAYPGVVAVGATLTEGMSGDVSQYVVPNSATDVAAPPVGAHSYTLTGRPCIVDEPTTSWSTAEVSGVLALLASAYPKASAGEIVDRLLRTASGREDVPGRYTGAGVVQAYDAVTRPLDDGRTAAPAPVARAHLGRPERDVLRGTRHAALWWGLVGGGALVLGLVLRPLLSRRRR